MKNLYFMYLCHEDVGEVEAMFNANGDMLGTWANNDANWRNEYFSPFMLELGFVVDELYPENHPDLENKIVQYWKEN